MSRGAPIIHNVSPSRVRFRLNFSQEPASAGVRRRPVTPEEGLDPHQQLDLCAKFKLTVEAAWRIVETSADLKKYANSAPPMIRIFERAAPGSQTSAPAAPATPAEVPVSSPVVLGAAGDDLGQLVHFADELAGGAFAIPGGIPETIGEVVPDAPQPPADALSAPEADPPSAPAAPPPAPLSMGRAIIPALETGPIDVSSAVFGAPAPASAGGGNAISPEVARAQINARALLEADVWQNMGADGDGGEDGVPPPTSAPSTPLGELPEGVVDDGQTVEAPAASGNENAPGVLGPEDVEGGAAEAGEDGAPVGTAAVPDSSWGVQRLEAYAQEHGIDLTGTQHKKPKILRRISDARERVGGAPAARGEK